MCLQDMKIARRLTPRLVTVLTPDPSFNAIPDFSRCLRVTVLVNAAVNTLRWQQPGPFYCNLPQELDRGAQETAVGPNAIQANYGYDALLPMVGQPVGVSNSGAEGSVRMIYWEMDFNTMSALYGDI